MDTGEVERIARQLSDRASATTRVAASANRLVRASEQLWFGGRADRWLADWVAQEVAIRRMGQFVDEMARHLRAQVAEQERASRAAGSLGAAAVAAVAPLRGLPQSPGLDDEARTAKALAQAAKSDGRENLPPGWRVHKVVHSGNGLDAVVFVDASGRYVVAYRGSETASDWLNNLTSLIRTPSQQREAVRFALELRRELGPDATIDFTGHSLGGALAVVSSLATGGKATTFNAAGVDLEVARMALDHGRPAAPHEGAADVIHKTLISRTSFLGEAMEAVLVRDLSGSIAKGQIVNYQMSTDPLSRVQEGRFTDNTVVDSLVTQKLAPLQALVGNPYRAFGEQIVINDGAPSLDPRDNHALSAFDRPTNTRK